VTPQFISTISARPVKSFFVHMLTRDIDLQDAILDLLDNSVDGIQRSETKRTLQRKKPYDGYWARISFSKDTFSIKDNCGGIPWTLHEYAFRMGRIQKGTDKGRRTVGTYGIGMKRAIFKIGQNCTVTTHAKDKSYQVAMSSAWMKDEDTWELEATAIRASKSLGTTVEVTDLHEGIASEFSSDQFESRFREAVATHYAYIMEKGFRVYINNREVSPKVIRLLFADAKRAVAKDNNIRPFIYQAEHEGVEVFLAVGFTSPIPSKEEADRGLENYQERYSSSEAGWTVICNDRTVLYCDKTAKTGWGVSGVPQYHTQFTAISGIVLFGADDASLLPTTTTKRGIDVSSELYMHVRDKMIEGMKLFTQYTNQWKSKELVARSRQTFKSTPAADLDEIKRSASQLTLSKTRGVVVGKQYKPNLPRPRKTKTTDRISFERSIKDIRKVSAYLFDTPHKLPKDVGGKCFDVILEEAGQ